MHILHSTDGCSVGDAFLTGRRGLAAWRRVLKALGDITACTFYCFVLVHAQVVTATRSATKTRPTAIAAPFLAESDLDPEAGGQVIYLLVQYELKDQTAQP